jgi:hypothetical protein
MRYRDSKMEKIWIIRIDFPWSEIPKVRKNARENMVDGRVKTNIGGSLVGWYQPSWKVDCITLIIHNTLHSICVRRIFRFQRSNSCAEHCIRSSLQARLEVQSTTSIKEIKLQGVKEYKVRWTTQYRTFRSNLSPQLLDLWTILFDWREVQETSR